MTRCSACGWEGKKEEMVSKEGGLLFYDYFYKNNYNIEIIRMNYSCPRCGQMIESRRVIPGMPEDITPQ
jgi:rubredoxin